MDIKEKIQEYIDYKSIKVTQFEVSIGASSGYWRKTKSISANIVCQIAGIYSDLSLDWLFRDTGEMIITEQSKQESFLQSSDAEIEKLKMQIARLEGQNDLLREQIGMAETKRSKTA